MGRVAHAGIYREEGMETRKPTIDDYDDPDDEDGQVLKEAKQDRDLKLRKKNPDYVSLDETVSAGIEDAGAAEAGSDDIPRRPPIREQPRIDIKE